MAEHLAIRLRKGKKLAGGLSLYVRPSFNSSMKMIKTSDEIRVKFNFTVIQKASALTEG